MFKHKGQEGFTLIELLVVVMILGILAIAVIPNVSRLMQTSAVVAANTEARSVQTAVSAYMADNTLSSYGEDVTPDDVDKEGPGEFLHGDLFAIYHFADGDGLITGADPKPADGRWADLKWDVDEDKWVWKVESST